MCASRNRLCRRIRAAMSLTSRSPLKPIRSAFASDGTTLRHVLSTPGGMRESVIDHAGPAPADTRSAWWSAYLRGERPRSTSAVDTRPLRTVELYCGPGGLALGLRQACDELGLAIDSLAAADQDADALSVHRSNHGDRMTWPNSVTMLVDHQVRGRGQSARFRYEPMILEESWRALAGSVDVLLAAPPCTGHSTLNYNRGRSDGGVRNTGDARNDLYLTVPAIAVALEAPIVIIENVPAVQWDEREVVATSVRLLIDAGYQVETATLSADSLGWPQSRSRFLLVARRDLAPLPLKVVAGALGDTPRPVMWAIAGLEDVTDQSYMSRTPDLSPENRDRIRWLFDNGAYDLPNSERPECHKDGTTYTAVYGRLHPDRPAPTITTGFMTPGRGRFVHPTRPRVLTASEAARLQGFPDTYDFRPDGREPSVTQLGKWIGDAVPMPLGYVAALSALAPGHPKR